MYGFVIDRITSSVIKSTSEIPERMMNLLNILGLLVEPLYRFYFVVGINSAASQPQNCQRQNHKSIILNKY